jgi:hypothetical protein
VARYLARAGIDVVEVDRPNRQTRHRKGKSDPVDAVAAARATPCEWSRKQVTLPREQAIAEGYDFR